jgi:hypothetical protein
MTFDQPLLCPVVQIAPQPATLIAGRLHDASARGVDRVGAQTLGVGTLALAGVTKHHDRATSLPHHHRRRRVAHGHERPVAADEPILLDAHRLAGLAGTEQRAVSLVEGPPVWMPIVDRGVAGTADELVLGVVAENANRGRIGEQNHSCVVDRVRGVDHAVHQGGQ